MRGGQGVDRASSRCEETPAEHAGVAFGTFERIGGRDVRGRADVGGHACNVAVNQALEDLSLDVEALILELD